MKQAIERLFVKDDSKEQFKLSAAIFMIVLFLTFWGASFYVLINSFA